jgi:tRNA nucleotidyltransferase (CCA-adding enzyme)
MSQATSLRTGAEVLGSLEDLPGGVQLLELADGRNDVELVGGAVRDLLLGATPRELDVVVGDDAAAFADELARHLDALTGQSSKESLQPSSHERFRTALVWWEGNRIDIATRRSERYPEPGVLPEVGEGTPEEDLQRRDFTVNAIALSLGGARRGKLRALPGALEDLSTGQLRVLHDDSFVEDPTRLLRLARYRARLGFAIDEHTASLAAAAVSSGALATVSLARVGAELRLALSEANMVAAVGSIGELGLLRALSTDLSFDEETANKALALLSETDTDTRPDLLLLITLLAPVVYPIEPDNISEEAKNRIRWLLNDLQFSASDRDLVLKALIDAPAIFHGGLTFWEAPSDIHKAASHASLEAVALVGAKAAIYAGRDDNPITEAARRWLADLHSVRLLITGADLLAAGIPEGPEIGRRLEAVLRMRLDGEVPDEREAQVRAALEGS